MKRFWLVVLLMAALLLSAAAVSAETDGSFE